MTAPTGAPTGGATTRYSRHGVRLPPPEHHRDVAGDGWLRPALFGAMDGLVSNTSLIAGVAGGGGGTRAAALAGLAGLFAGAFSMAAGEYTSVRAQTEAIRAEIAMEARELARSPESEEAELAEAYVARGLSPDLADQVAAALSAHPEQALRAHTQEELGVDPDHLADPRVAAGSSFVAFALGAVIPLAPYLFGAALLWLSVALAAVALFACGAVVSRFTGRGLLFSGGRQLLVGAAAVLVTFGIGHAVGTSVG